MSDRRFAGDEAETEELDLDEENGASIDEVMQSALDAVQMPRAKEESQENPFDAVKEDSSAALHDEIKELRDRSMRTLADFDNFRKRVDRERQEQRRYAGTEILRELLAVIDNLGRAVESRGSDEEMRQGVELILRQMEELLKRHGVERVSADGARFDPTAHEAVVRHESDEVSEPTIVKELQAGYWLHDRLLRPALVEVAVPQEPATVDLTGALEEPED
jgi:molecular chaperone GrpE